MFSYNTPTGFYMSDEALSAYGAGEKPMSGWTKKALLDAIEKIDENVLNLVKQLKKEELIDQFLTKTAEYETSTWNNLTVFYTVDPEKVKQFSEKKLQEVLDSRSGKVKKQDSAPELWRCKFLQWEGTYPNSRAIEVVEEGEIRGSWFYRSNGTKKKITSKGFLKLEKI